MYKKRTRLQLLAPPGPSTATKAKEKGNKKINKIQRIATGKQNARLRFM